MNSNIPIESIKDLQLVPTLERCLTASDLMPAPDLTSLAWAAGLLVVGGIVGLATILAVAFLHWRTIRPQAWASAPRDTPSSHHGWTAGDSQTPKVVSFHASVWRAANDEFGSAQVAILERCMARAGFRFGDDDALDVALPLYVQIRAADEIVQARERMLYPSNTVDQMAQAVHQTRMSGYGVALVTSMLSAARLCGRYVQVTQKPTEADVDFGSHNMAEPVEELQALSIAYRLAALQGARWEDCTSEAGQRMLNLVEEAAHFAPRMAGAFSMHNK